MNIKDSYVYSGKSGRSSPHGLSRAGSSGVLPVLLGLGCAVLVLGVLWLAYTFG